MHAAGHAGYEKTGRTAVETGQEPRAVTYLRKLMAVLLKGRKEQLSGDLGQWQGISLACRSCTWHSILRLLIPYQADRMHLLYKRPLVNSVSLLSTDSITGPTGKEQQVCSDQEPGNHRQLYYRVYNIHGTVEISRQA